MVGVVGLSMALEQKPLLSVLLVRGIMAMFLTNKKQVPIPNESTQIRFQNDDLHRVLVSSGTCFLGDSLAKNKYPMTQVPDECRHFENAIWVRPLGMGTCFLFLSFLQ